MGQWTWPGTWTWAWEFLFSVNPNIEIWHRVSQWWFEWLLSQSNSLDQLLHCRSWSNISYWGSTLKPTLQLSVSLLGVWCHPVQGGMTDCPKREIAAPGSWVPNGWHYTTQGYLENPFLSWVPLKLIHHSHTSKLNLQYSSWHHSLFDKTTIEALIEDGKCPNLISASGQAVRTAVLYLALMSVKLLFSLVRADWQL